MHVAVLCNGSTNDSGSFCQGSNPCTAANERAPAIAGAFFVSAPAERRAPSAARKRRTGTLKTVDKRRAGVV